MKKFFQFKSLKLYRYLFSDTKEKVVGTFAGESKTEKNGRGEPRLAPKIEASAEKNRRDGEKEEKSAQPLNIARLRRKIRCDR